MGKTREENTRTTALEEDPREGTAEINSTWHTKSTGFGDSAVR